MRNFLILAGESILMKLLIFRLYQIKDDEALNVTVIPVGEKPTVMFPGSKTPFLECYGETAIDFDFGHPEISTQPLWLNQDNINKSILSPINKTVEGKYVDITLKSNI